MSPAHNNRLFANGFLIVIVAVLIGGGVIIFQLRKNKDQSQTLCNSCATLKKETRRIYDGVISFDVPIGWNTYINGDTQYLDIKNLVLDIQNTFTSVSSEDRPVTLSDINWQQLDFYITDGDYIGLNYSMAIKNTEAETMQTVKNDYFEGYSSTSILQSGETPSKANTGGVTYFLRLKISDPKWNLIIDKQAFGDASFEAAVKKIIESIQFISQ